MFWGESLRKTKLFFHLNFTEPKLYAQLSYKIIASFFDIVNNIGHTFTLGFILMSVVRPLQKLHVNPA